MSSNKSWLHNFATKFLKQTQYNPRLFEQTKLLTINRFKWENLPIGVEGRHIEEMLFNNGQCFFTNSDVGFLVMNVQPKGNFNIYGDALDYKLTSNYGNFTLDRKADEGVLIISNDLQLPTILQVQHYTTLIDEIEKTMYMNLKQQRLPYIIPTTKENELSIRKLLEKIDNFEYAILTDKKLEFTSDNGLDVLSLNTPFLLDKLQQHKNNVYNELLTFLGINNITQNKKERLIVDEVNINNQNILHNLDNEYKNRLIACDKINKMFNLNIKVTKTLDELECDFNGGIE